MSVKNPLPSLIGESPAFLDTLQKVSVAALIDRPLLVIGERGTGKELIAERIHFLSSRWDGPFVKVNCAALSEDLLDSELFGHEAGAFTGAKQRRPGRFERADGGTLFLDEIATASATVQEKLLRVIEYGEFERVGGSETITCSVRVIGATNVNLAKAVEEGSFRADLLDRLAFDVIPMPPMRARREDILPLAEFYGAAMASEVGDSWPGLTQKAYDTLLGYDWPGNVRELKNVMERSTYRHLAVADAGEPVDTIILDPFATPWPLAAMPRNRVAEDGNDVPASAPSQAEPAATPEAVAGTAPEESYSLEDYLNRAERQAVADALALHDGHQKRTSDYLKLSYDQMRGLVRKHGLSTRQRSR